MSYLIIVYELFIYIIQIVYKVYLYKLYNYCIILIKGIHGEKSLIF